MIPQGVNGVGRVKDNDDGPIETLGTQDLIRRAAAQQWLATTILKEAMCGVSPTNCAAAATFAATQRRENEAATQRKGNEASPTTCTSSPIAADSQDGGYKGLCTYTEERGVGRAHLPDIPEEQLSLMSVTSSSLPPSPAHWAASCQTGPRHADWVRETGKENVFSTRKENVFSTYRTCTTAFTMPELSSEMLTHTTHTSHSVDPRGESETMPREDGRESSSGRILHTTSSSSSSSTNGPRTGRENSSGRILQILNSRGADFTRSDVRHSRHGPLEEDQDLLAAAPEETSLCSNALRVRGPLVEEDVVVEEDLFKAKEVNEEEEEMLAAASEEPDAGTAACRGVLEEDEERREEQGTDEDRGVAEEERAGGRGRGRGESGEGSVEICYVGEQALSPNPQQHRCPPPHPGSEQICYLESGTGARERDTPPQLAHEVSSSSPALSAVRCTPLSWSTRQQQRTHSTERTHSRETPLPCSSSGATTTRQQLLAGLCVCVCIHHTLMVSLWHTDAATTADR